MRYSADQMFAQKPTPKVIKRQTEGSSNTPKGIIKLSLNYHPETASENESLARSEQQRILARPRVTAIAPSAAAGSTARCGSPAARARLIAFRIETLNESQACPSAIAVP